MLPSCHGECASTPSRFGQPLVRSAPVISKRVMLELRCQATHRVSVRTLNGLLLGALAFAGRALLWPRPPSPASAHPAGSSCMTFKPGEELPKITPVKQPIARRHRRLCY